MVALGALFCHFLQDGLPCIASLSLVRRSSFATWGEVFLHCRSFGLEHGTVRGRLLARVKRSVRFSGLVRHDSQSRVLTVIGSVRPIGIFLVPQNNLLPLALVAAGQDSLRRWCRVSHLPGGLMSGRRYVHRSSFYLSIFF